jgi:competence protein ComEA
VRRALLAAAAVLLLLGAVPAAAKRRSLAPGEKVDLNRASIADLMRLPGIGRQRAEAIAALRAKRPFRSPSEVTQVKGIGKAWLERNRASLAAGEPATRPKASPAP